jgi:hypothetical protein
MNNTTLSATPEIEALLAAIDSTPEGMLQVLRPDEPWYQEPADVWVRPESEVTAAAVREIREALAIGDFYNAVFVNFYDLTGRQLGWTDMPEGWWQSNLALTGRESTAISGSRPNAVGRFGADYLIVGRGHYLAVAETTLDGLPAFEFVTHDEQWRRTNQKAQGVKRAHLDAHPAIEAAMPAWAGRVSIELPDEGDDDQSTLVSYEVEIDVLGDVFFDQHARYVDGVVTFENEPGFGVGRDRVTDFGRLKEAAARLLRAIAIVEGR